jgi:multidrug efflux system membrane fusion protein
MSIEGRQAPGPETPARQRLRKNLPIVGAVAVCIAAIVVVMGIASRMHATSLVKGWTSTVAIPVVAIVNPTQQPATQSLALPGQLQALYNAPIYSRVSGYVQAWYDDIGARVRAGQLLATIETPELDQQLVQARADLVVAQANMQLANITAQRWSRLLTQDAVSKQESDEKTGDLAAKTALVQAAKANVDRLVALKSFSRIVAPFDGVVTARKTDIGALVNAGAGANTSSELFDVAKVNQLRLYVQVPQTDSAHIRPGITATLTVPEYPGRTFTATLSTTANSVSDKSGTLLVELMVDNADGMLKAGDYAQVLFEFPAEGAGGANTVLAPASALLFRNKDMEAAVVDNTNHVHIRHVTIGRDLGTAMEVTSGLSLSDRVVNNPPDSIADGELVRVLSPDAGQPRKGPDAAG